MIQKIEAWNVWAASKMGKHKGGFGNVTPYSRKKVTGGHAISVKLNVMQLGDGSTKKEVFECLNDLQDFLRHQNPGMLKHYKTRLEKYFEIKDLGNALTIKIKSE